MTENDNLKVALKWLKDQIVCGHCGEGNLERSIRHKHNEMIDCILAHLRSTSAVPAGCRLVPEEPTREMWGAMGDAVLLLANRFNGDFPHHDVVSEAIYDAALAAAPAPPVEAPRETVWQSIETAPKDGTEFLAYWQPINGDPQIIIAQWISDGPWRGLNGVNVVGMDGLGSISSLTGGFPDATLRATHWMPLPPTPTDAPVPERRKG